MTPLVEAIRKVIEAEGGRSSHPDVEALRGRLISSARRA